MVSYFQFASCVTCVSMSNTNFTALIRHQTRVIDPSNIERTSNRCLNSQICFWTICIEKNESKFKRNEALSDLSNSDAFFHCAVIHCIKCMVLFLMTYIWHFDVANKDVFTRSTTFNWRQTLKFVFETDGWKKMRANSKETKRWVICSIVIPFALWRHSV